MRVFRSFYAAAKLVLAAQIVAWPNPVPMPESVPEGGEAIQYLWTAADNGCFYNTLTNQHSHLQPAWSKFLRTYGSEAVEKYYQ